LVKERGGGKLIIFTKTKIEISADKSRSGCKATAVTKYIVTTLDETVEAAELDKDPWNYTEKYKLTLGLKL
jgi:hypothetical protein